MIQAVVLLRILNGHHVLDVFHHTNGGCIAARIGTDGTRFGVADVVAKLTILNVFTHFEDG